MRPQYPQRGFGLIEIMVGLLIGMVASIVIFQVFSVAERQKRTTGGSADAQTNAAFSLYQIERDAKMAGFGIEADSIAQCTEIFSYFNDGSGDKTLTEFNVPTAISIKDGGGNSADEIKIIYYANPADDNFVIPSNTTLRSTMPQPSAELNVNSTSGCAENTLALAQQGGKCTVMQITQVQAAALKIQHNPGGAGTPENPVYNPHQPYMTANNWPAYTSGATIRCGLTPPISRTYSLNTGSRTLQSRDSNIGVTQTVSPNVVTLQAQYGIADAGTLPFKEWVDATGAWAEVIAGGVQTSPTKENGKRIKAIRVAVVARSAEYEKPDPGQACNTTTDAMVQNWSSWANLTAVKTLPDWQCYRYKVVETVIPLRNLIWANLK